MTADQTDYRRVGRELYAAIRRLGELQRLYESHQWPPAIPESFDTALATMLLDPEWRQGRQLGTEAQTTCAAALVAGGMSTVAAQRVAQMKRDFATVK
jgi:hypothetical protein